MNPRFGCADYRPFPIHWLVAVPVALFQLALAVPRQWRMETTGFDLGIFEQGVRGYAGLRPPTATLKGTGFDLLGDHFSPLLAVLAPVYRLWPSAVTLLVAQALLLALSTVPISALAAELLGRRRGVAIGLAYGFSWGLWRADAFDVHEVALAVPLAAWSVVALARGRWWAAVCWGLPLLLVKEDQGLLLAGIGGYVWLAGRRRALGLAAVLVAVLGTVLAVLLIVPAVNPGGHYTYGAGAAWHGGDPVARLVRPVVKWRTVAALLAPTLLLALRSPIALLLVLPLAARFWSLDPAYWTTGQHYNAVLMPVLFTALLDGLRRIRRRAVRPVVLAAAPPREPAGAGGLRLEVRRSAVARATEPRLLRWIPGAVLVVALSAAPVPDLSGPSAQVVAARRVLAVIPDGARVAAANALAPQLTGRCTVSLFPYLTHPGQAGPRDRPVADWVAALDQPDDFPVPRSEQLAVEQGLAAAGYRPVAAGGGVTVWRWAA
ncbi:DUF2079 domain-containing protein [Kitasatospora sp. RB6PN24]|uniref:DUF2079 domain-containing protein n=1 Tax=Kitasatospora humi TaxID=2893891 RepID=UPI001E64A7DE|nr:DUF2079 domain-containing protein [Kitasatospora humi]MCC9311187.1 DUF2079 domain-containing protein [Kitasatospora humi]